MILGVILLCICILIIIFRGECAKHIISSQNNTWGFRFTEKTVKNTEIQLIFILLVELL